MVMFKFVYICNYCVYKLKVMLERVQFYLKYINVFRKLRWGGGVQIENCYCFFLFDDIRKLYLFLVEDL